MQKVYFRLDKRKGISICGAKKPEHLQYRATENMHKD